MFDLELTKQNFKAKGWSYRAAAPVLGVTYQYLCDVLNGRHSSIRLTARIEALPLRDANPTPRRSQKQPQLTTA
jgi:hypothetical protein